MALYTVFEQFPILTTTRCRLVKPQLDQAQDLYEIYGDPQTMAYMQQPCVADSIACEELIKKWQKDFDEKRGIRWAITRKEDPRRLIGTFALHYWSQVNQSIEMGADVNKGYWGQGIISEIVGPVLDFAFTNLFINRIELRCDPRNRASIKIAEKFGMRREGVLEEYVFVEGKGFVDEVVYALLKKRYQRQKRTGHG